MKKNNKKATRTQTLSINKISPKSKRSQVTIFIIVAIMLVALIFLYFILQRDIDPDSRRKPEENPEAFLEECLEKQIREGLEKIGLQGGYIEPTLYKTFKFEGDQESVRDIAYLCYNHNYYQKCINQQPLLIQHLKKEMYNYLSENNPDETDYVYDCMSDLASTLENAGFTTAVNHARGDFDVNMMNKKIIIDIRGELRITHSGETTRHEDFKIRIPSRFYDLAVVAQEITSQEARFCNFESLGFMLFYYKFDIDRFTTGDGTRIYTITHKDSKERFRFAIRSCATLPGL